MTESLQIKKITPSPKELVINSDHSNTGLKCSVPQCGYVAATTSLLGLHKAKTHNIKNVPESNTVYHYHCPVAGCYFNPNSERYFKSLDILKTHYMKLHSEKKFSCEKCKKAFGLERDCLRHQKDCGKVYSCPDCGKTYTALSSLISHCIYNKHKKPDAANKDKVSKTNLHPKKKADRRQTKTVLPRNGPVPILPKQIILNTTTPAPSFVVNSKMVQTPRAKLHQTDVSVGPDVVRVAADQLITQAVQTGHFKRSAGIQTSCDAFTESNNAGIIKLSTGIQTGLPIVSHDGRDQRMAETQTRESILQKAMTSARIPVLKVCKGTQKSQGKVKPQKRKIHVGAQTTSAQPMKRYLSTSTMPVVSSSFQSQSNGQIDLVNLNQYLSTISTQTQLSCVDDQFSVKSTPQPCHSLHLQNTHTQTNIISRDNRFQTDFELLSYDQDTQTAIPSYLQMAPNNHSGIYADYQTQDCYTQTSQGSLHNKIQPIINDIETQTFLSSLEPPAKQDQSTVTYNTMLSVAQCKNVSSMTCSDLIQELPFSAQPKFNSYAQQNTAPMSLNQELRNVDDSVNQVSSCQSVSEGTSVTPDELTDLLMDVIKSTETSCKSPPLILGPVQDENHHVPTSQPSDPNKSQFSHSSQLESGQVSELSNVNSCSTSIGSDITTQTMDLAWDIGTQTMTDFVADMMTQTGDDLLEFLTSGTQTQTLDEIYGPSPLAGQFDSNDTDKTTATTDIAIQLDVSDFSGDHVSTQTMWEICDDQTLDLKENSFAFPPEMASVACGSSPRMGGESNWANENNYSLFDSQKDSDTNVIPCSSSTATDQNGIEQAIHLSARTTETSETQTLFDPFFANTLNIEMEESLPLSHEPPKKLLESCHTQTAYDPMLPILPTDDEPGEFSHNISAMNKGYVTNLSNTGRGTAECQTPWNDFLSLVEDSETQTQDAGTFTDAIVPSINCHTQTMSTLQTAAEYVVIDSFTQTSLDQNTQTQPYDIEDLLNI